MATNRVYALVLARHNACAAKADLLCRGDVRRPDATVSSTTDDKISPADHVGKSLAEVQRLARGAAKP
jgi:hypothetical protein